MPRRTLSLTAALFLLAALAGSVEKDSLFTQVKEIGDQVRCQCGCSYTVGSCNMLNCHYREPVLADIRAGLEAGKTKAVILDEIYAKYGDHTRVEPQREGFGMVGWAMPFVALLIGMALVPFVVRKWRTNAASQAGPDEVPDEVVDKYRAQIEKDLEELE